MGVKRKTAGDATGRKKAQLEQERSQDQKEREQEMAMTAATEQRRFDEEVEDVTAEAEKSGNRKREKPPETEVIVGETGEQVDEVEVSQSELVNAPPEEPATAQVSEDPRDAVSKLLASDDPELQALGKKLQEQESSVTEQNVIAEKPTKVIRTNTDISNMTLGVGTNYNFEAGKKYRVPTPVANHLERLGLIWH